MSEFSLRQNIVYSYLRVDGAHGQAIGLCTNFDIDSSEVLPLELKKMLVNGLRLCCVLRCHLKVIVVPISNVEGG